MSYPHYLHLNDQLRPDVSVYYNIDDYTLYWPERAQQIRELERATVLAADVTICVSRLRADELIAAIPEAAGRIHHVPHGTPTPFLAQQPLIQPAEAPADLRKPSSALPGLCRLARRPDRLGAHGQAEHELSGRVDRGGGASRAMRWPSPGGKPARGSCPAPTSTPWAGARRTRSPDTIRRLTSA